ncbi:abortive infection protein [Marichromatium purpuratum 984]|uniref:Abortive infection protein n=1 Tax=Marichromatium purpuratum 984 TaxID=765910 RepID=W0E2K0_MARPU|nr:CPBP family intramembrane glutamic endopeptidase [Marichromatium purpuratum]AHF05090.1 abortive infection protein [Marichromatium purpuratum 984]
MRATSLFFLYLLACLALAALLTGPLMQTGWIDYEAQRVMGRLAQVFILLGLWPLLIALRLDTRAALGLDHPAARLRRTVWQGWVLGVAILLTLALALLGLGIRIPDPTPPGWAALASRALQALIGGLLIGLLEEAFFRGALYAAIRRDNGVRSAVLWSAGLYAVLHFMKPGELPPGMALDAAGLWYMFSHVFIDLFQWHHLDSMVALFMVGVFLALVRERSGHIGWCIGLHAGWVLVIQVTRQLTDGDPGAPLAFLAGDYDGTIGWLAAAWIGLLAALYWWWTGRAARRR